MAIAIRRPTNDRSVWKPNRAVLRHGAPATVVVQVFIANHIGRDVARRLRTIFTAVAVRTEAIEVVAIVAKALDVGVQLVDTGKRAGLP